MLRKTVERQKFTYFKTVVTLLLLFYPTFKSQLLLDHLM